MRQPKLEEFSGLVLTMIFCVSGDLLNAIGTVTEVLISKMSRNCEKSQTELTNEAEQCIKKTQSEYILHIYPNESNNVCPQIISHNPLIIFLHHLLMIHTLVVFLINQMIEDGLNFK